MISNGLKVREITKYVSLEFIYEPRIKGIIHFYFKVLTLAMH